MPTYQYACTACDERLEAVQSFTDAPLTECPACGGTLRKVFSAVGVVFKGSGFYKTDSRGATSGGKGDATSDGASAGGKADSSPAAGSGGDKAAAAASSSGSTASSSSSSAAAPSAPASKSA